MFRCTCRTSPLKQPALPRSRSNKVEVNGKRCVTHLVMGSRVHRHPSHVFEKPLGPRRMPEEGGSPGSATGDSQEYGQSSEHRLPPELPELRHQSSALNTRRKNGRIVNFSERSSIRFSVATVDMLLVKVRHQNLVICALKEMNRPAKCCRPFAESDEVGPTVPGHIQTSRKPDCQPAGILNTLTGTGFSSASRRGWERSCNRNSETFDEWFGSWPSDGKSDLSASRRPQLHGRSCWRRWLRDIGSGSGLESVSVGAAAAEFPARAAGTNQHVRS